MSNMMPGDNSGAEPDEHYNDCRTNCLFADTALAAGEECPVGHGDHECNCEDCAEDWAEIFTDGWN